jgi:multidrug efflux pump
MHFTEFFIKRPAFTLVLMLVISIIGLISYANLPVRWIPNVAPPIVSIYTNFSGASASLVESQITTPIESALSGVDGVETLTSNSSQGESSIELSFQLGKKMDAAVEDVRSSLSAVSSLPKDVLTPYVAKANTNNMPILFMAFSDQHRKAKEVSDYVDKFIIPRLQTADGVATVLTYGRQASAMRIWLDPAKMAISNVAVDDVINALSEQNIEVPSGQIRGKDRYFTLVTNETLTSVEQFNNLIIHEDDKELIRLKNIGLAEIAPVNIDTAFRVQGQPAVAVGIIPQSSANPLNVANVIQKRFAEITKTLPAGMQASIVFDMANFISASVHSVYEALIEAALCVLLVIYLFLGNWRATLIPVLTIPVCLLATFTFLHIFNFSINTITLMAFVLAIGLVVDDAIVVLENITRHIEGGSKPFTAAIEGSKEIVFPIIAMTFTLVAVYTPIAFTTGVLGAVFSEFALTLASAVLVSGIVALSLSPMMCARLLSSKQQKTYYAEKFAGYFSDLQSYYQHSLTYILERRIWVIILLLIIGVSGYFLFHSLPNEFAPIEDTNEIDVYISAPHDASFQYTNSYVEQLEGVYKVIPEIESYLSIVGGDSASFSVQVLTLKPWYKRHRSAEKISDDLNLKLNQIPGIRANASPPPSPLTSFTEGSSGASVAMAVMTSGEYKDLHGVMQLLMDELKKYPIFSFVDNQLKWDRSQFEVTVDREKAANMQVPLANITNTISTLLAGKNVGKFEFDGKQYDVILQLNQENLANMNIISQLYVRSHKNNMVSLAGLADMHETTKPGSLPHYERLRADTLFASLAPGYTIAQAITVLEQISKKILPDNMKTAFMGEARSYLESNNKMVITFLLSLIFIYLVLVAQFESFIDPLIILLTVPFAVIGALLALKLAGASLNIYSNIGLVTLIGLIAKHGILITDFANRYRASGISIIQAVSEAALLRLRPILMTTSAMTLGALPLALALGAGAETRHQIGWVIVGGMIIGTFFSLIVVPVAYTYLAPFKKFDIK